ncbi:hypothetical protein CCDG5_1809 [[Clostridium] cellulosi]|jgi:RNA methyltransferase, RsmE family|uniref:Ribosomal RNA small subunit methyltransferase E n=1 Tax=[Clostridium] cellulosi TaxID=29343 RepID=A0A078KQZ8_9FIRM|nr:hypothetical protein CCDG5_1809 [[Clostridium] cellulosi]
MPKFFIDAEEIKDTASIVGADAAHIAKVLRMKVGEPLTVCDCRGFDYTCEIVSVSPTAVSLNVLERTVSLSEPTVKVTLFQGLPKGDKMDLIVQKSVELGVSEIVPVITRRSVSRPDKKTLLRKIERWNKIAAEAAKQCGRGILPKVADAVDFYTAAEMAKDMDLPIMLYERSGGTMGDLLSGCIGIKTFGVMVGPEGGFDDIEVSFARERNIRTAGMGPRILRTETAPLSALSVIMYATGNL